MKNIVLLLSILFVSLTVLAQDGNYVETNGVRIYYETHGQGEPLLLLHGFTLSHKSWEPWVDDLSKNYKLIIPDLRGHGNSTNPSKKYTAKMSAIDMYGLMAKLNIKEFKAIGQSNGAVVLTHMATIDTSRITTMILVSGAPYLTDAAISILSGVSYDAMRSHMEPLHPGGEKQIKMLLEQMRSFPENIDDINFTPPYLASIKCPTLIISGDRDPFSSIDMPSTLYKSIPNSYLWIVPNEGHFPAGIYDRNSIWSDVLYKVMEDFFEGKWK